MHFTPRILTDAGSGPGCIIKTGNVPSPDLFPGIIADSEVDAVLHKGTVSVLPILVRDDFLISSVPVSDLQLGNKDRFPDRQVLPQIPLAPLPEGKWIIEAVPKGNSQTIVSGFQLRGDIVFGVIDPLAKVCPGRIEYIFPYLPAIKTGPVIPCSGDIKPGVLDG